MNKYFLLISLSITLFACKKIINVDLNNAPPQLVIEGLVNDVNPATITISKSVIFSSSNTFPSVSGAFVTIKDNVGNTYTLSESSSVPGTYTTSAILG